MDTSTIDTNVSAFAVILYVILSLGFYVYYAVCLQKMAAKTNTPNGWMGWVPILNVFLMLAIAKKPYWWFLLMLIPLVNIVIIIIVYMKMAENLGKESWMGLLMIIPLVNLFILGYLAFSNVQSVPPVSGSSGPTPLQ